jgi:hypothetical protein
VSFVSFALTSCAQDADATRQGGPDLTVEAGVDAATDGPGPIYTPADDVADVPRGDGNLHPELPQPWLYWTSPDGKIHAYKDPASPINVLGKFKGEAAAPSDSGTGRPVLLYPLAGSMHPMNLGLITFQWMQGNPDNTLFQIEAMDGDVAFLFYFMCNTGECTPTMPQSEWLDLGRRFAGRDITFTVSGTTAAGGPIEVSDPLTISFSPAPVLGGLYYWASSVPAIKRATFGSFKAVPYLAPGDAKVGLGNTACVACHSVSRDGKTAAYAVTSAAHDTDSGTGANWPWGIFVNDTSDLTKPYLNPVDASGMVVQSYGSYPALNADGTLLAVNGNNPATGSTPVYFDVRNARDGTSLHRQDMQTHGVFGTAYDMALYPEWSPDGKSIAVTLTSINWACFWDHKTCGGTIGVIPWDDATKKMRQAVPLVQDASGAAPASYCYPTWSPDGKWIAFSTARPALVGETAAQNCYDAKDAVLRIIPSDTAGAPYACPGPKCIELTNATRYGWADAVAGNGRGSGLPKFTPFAQGANDNLFFITYTSRINYGFAVDPELHQLWMAAVDMNRAAAGDPSYAPFWVPYQDVKEKNVEPYWTEILACAKDPSGGCKGCVGGEECKVDVLTNDCFCEASIK